MFYRVIFLVILAVFNVVSINLTYIVKKDEHVIYPSCIAEELERYAAIGWIYPIPDDIDKLPNISTKFLPTIENDYNCKFSKNSICNTRWSLKDWNIDDSSPATKDPLFDNRWEDLPTVFISNKTKEFGENFELNNTTKASFSVRAEGIVELFFCSGWDPYNYPCYYFYVNYRKIYFKVFQTLPKNSSEVFGKNILQEYGAFSDILSHSEWKSFVVSFESDGMVKLIDLNLGRTLIEQTVKEKITPLYMFMRSANSSLWKFHENHFLKTNTPQISRLGPQLTVTSKDLCVSLLVQICEQCEMSFFYLNGTKKKLLKHVEYMKSDGGWFEIKLKDENIELDKVNLFVETKLTNGSTKDTGFWAIDNVRVCNENEVKVTYLKSDSVFWSETDVSCQVIKKSNWRPKPRIFNKIQEFPQVKSISETDSMKLSWSPEDPSNQISYFISYQANDLCMSEPFNLQRKKSNGFLNTKLTEVVLNNLVPFTLYNITISTVLHESEKKMLVHTLETDELKLEELPYKVQVRPLDTAVRVSWEPVNCFQRYGRIVYSIVVSNKDLNFAANVSLQTDTSYEIKDLQPFTQYTLTIIAARNGRNIYQNKFANKFKFNFTTSAGVAPPVHNLELYSIDKSSASLRFDLPVNPRGITREVQVSKCNALSFSKCKSTISPLRECPFWPGKYCVDIQYLIPYQTYSFRVSLKNINTHTFGKEMSVDGYTNDRVPGAPRNVTYRIVGCDQSTEFCHLNVSWLHPYNQNGTITAFNIILNSTDEHRDINDTKYIQEVYKIENNTYYSYYTYQIKYLPYSSHYDLYLQSENMAYKSDFAQIPVKTNNIGDHIDQSPKLLTKTESNFMFELPILDKRLRDYEVTVVVQDYNYSVKVDPAIMGNKKISNRLCHRYGNSWISQTHEVNSSKTVKITIGDHTEKERLVPGQKYCIIFIIKNNYRGEEHEVVYYEKLRLLQGSPTLKEASTDGTFNPLYLLLLLLILLPIGYLIYRYTKRNKRKPNNTADVKENVYESLPFEDCESNYVVNENYDKLIHE